MLDKLNKKSQVRSDLDIFLEIISQNLILKYLLRGILDTSENGAIISPVYPTVDNSVLQSDREQDFHILFIYETSKNIWMPSILDIKDLSEFELIDECVKHLSINKNELVKKIIKTELIEQAREMTDTPKGELQLEFEINYFLKNNLRDEN